MYSFTHLCLHHLDDIIRMPLCTKDREAKINRVQVEASPNRVSQLACPHLTQAAQGILPSESPQIVTQAVHCTSVPQVTGVGLPEGASSLASWWLEWLHTLFWDLEPWQAWWRLWPYSGLGSRYKLGLSGQVRMFGFSLVVALSCPIIPLLSLSSILFQWPNMSLPLLFSSLLGQNVLLFLHRPWLSWILSTFWLLSKDWWERD